MDSPTVQGDHAGGLPPHHVPSLIPPAKRKFKRRGGRGRRNTEAHRAAPLLTVAGSEPENPDLLPVQQQQQVPSAASATPPSVPTVPAAPGGQGTGSVFAQESHSRSDLLLMARMLESCTFDIPAAAYSELAKRYTLVAMGRQLPGMKSPPSYKFQMAAARFITVLHSKNWQMATSMIGKQEVHLHAHQHTVVTDSDERSAALAGLLAELAKRDALERCRIVEAGVVDQHDGG